MDNVAFKDLGGARSEDIELMAEIYQAPFVAFDSNTPENISLKKISSQFQFGYVVGKVVHSFSSTLVLETCSEYEKSQVRYSNSSIIEYSPQHFSLSYQHVSRHQFTGQ